MTEIKKILEGEEFVVQPPEELNLEKQTLNPKLMLDDELYDEDEDEDNARWVQQMRDGYHNMQVTQPSDTTTAENNQQSNTSTTDTATNNSMDSTKQTQKHKPAAKHRSDALLCCPACMTTVCIDCQRHDVYKNQFRAMFVMNCTVNYEQLLR